MKKLLAAVLIMFCGFVYSVYAADDDQTNYSPVSISSAGTKVGSTIITFNAIPVGTKARNCITDISMSADNFPAAGFSLSVLDGSATAYYLSQSSMSIIESWYPKNPLCLSRGTTTYISVGSGNFKVNVSGYQKDK